MKDMCLITQTNLELSARQGTQRDGLNPLTHPKRTENWLFLFSEANSEGYLHLYKNLR